jgi:diamine N-acetyltransferase
MGLLENDVISLRALEPDDLDLLFSVENDSHFWEISNTLAPYSRDLLGKYLKNAHQDIYEAKQVRLVISRKSDNCILGLADLFDFNPQHNRAGIGILILKKYQQQGYASKALQVFVNYAFEHLDIHQLYANIPVTNKGSLHLFHKFNFQQIGIQKEWIKVKGKFHDVILLQLINPKHL